MLLKEACKRGTYELTIDQFNRTFKELDDFVNFSTTHTVSVSHLLKGWQKTADLPQELKPPFTEVKGNMAIVIARRNYEYHRILKSTIAKGKKKFIESQTKK